MSVRKKAEIIIKTIQRAVKMTDDVKELFFLAIANALFQNVKCEIEPRIILSAIRKSSKTSLGHELSEDEEKIFLMAIMDGLDKIKFIENEVELNKDPAFD